MRVPTKLVALSASSLCTKLTFHFCTICGSGWVSHSFGIACHMWALFLSMLQTTVATYGIMSLAFFMLLCTFFKFLRFLVLVLPKGLGFLFMWINPMELFHACFFCQLPYVLLRLFICHAEWIFFIPSNFYVTLVAIQRKLPESRAPLIPLAHWQFVLQFLIINLICSSCVSNGSDYCGWQWPSQVR